MSGRMMSNNIALQAGKKLANIDPQTQWLFKLYDISDDDWRLWSKTAYKEINGEEFITPDSLRTLDRREIRTHLEDLDLDRS